MSASEDRCCHSFGGVDLHVVARVLDDREGAVREDGVEIDGEVGAEVGAESAEDDVDRDAEVANVIDSAPPFGGLGNQVSVTSAPASLLGE